MYCTICQTRLLYICDEHFLGTLHVVLGDKPTATRHGLHTRHVRASNPVGCCQLDTVAAACNSTDPTFNPRCHGQVEIVTFRTAAARSGMRSGNSRTLRNWGSRSRCPRACIGQVAV
jgi:hypothetical protein